MNGISHTPKYNLGQVIWYAKNGGVFPVVVTKISSQLRRDRSITDYYDLTALTPEVSGIEGSGEKLLGLTPEEALIKAYGDKYVRDGMSAVAPSQPEKPNLHPISRTIASLRQHGSSETTELGFSPA